MFTGMPQQRLTRDERELIKLFKGLSDQNRHTVMQFASFLSSDDTVASIDDDVVDIQAPLEIPRPENESVIKAIKRLSKTYPMVDTESMLDKTSSLMSEHILQGRAAKDVIDELEVMFETAYQALKKSDET